MYKVGLYHDFVCRKSTLDELLPGEFRKGDIKVNLPAPGAEQAMKR